MSASQLAKAAAATVAPELAIPLEAAFGIARRARAARAQPPVVIQPQERTPVLRLGKDRITVRTKAGVRVLEVHRAPAITVSEAIAIAAIGGLAYGAYTVSKQVPANQSGPKLSGHGGYLPGADGWGLISW